MREGFPGEGRPVPVAIGPSGTRTKRVRTRAEGVRTRELLSIAGTHPVADRSDQVCAVCRVLCSAQFSCTTLQAPYPRERVNSMRGPHSSADLKGRRDSTDNIAVRHIPQLEAKKVLAA